MRALILAAGSGSRMGTHTADKPKAMLEFAGKTLLDRQIDTLSRAGIQEIAVVTGYRAEALVCGDDIVRYHNEAYNTTNMVTSLMCARDFLEGDVLVCYADIVYTTKLVRDVAAATGPVDVAVDPVWREYWVRRYGTTETDLESLTVREGRIVELGEPRDTSDGIDYRYVGMIRFTRAALPAVFDTYEAHQGSGTGWAQSGNTFENGYMTDLLSELASGGVHLSPVEAGRQWIEFDTSEDYARMIEDWRSGALAEYFDISEL